MSKAVSFSRYSLYKKCPASYEWQYVLGNKPEREAGGAAARGTLIHNSIEDAYNLKDPSLLHPEIPASMKPKILEHYGICEDVRPEMEFAVTKDWKETEFEADDAYIRGFMDNVFVYPDKLHIHEYKSGREYDEHVDQKQMYAMVALVLFPEYNTVEVKGIYTDGKFERPTKYGRGHLFAMQHHWKKEIDKMAIPIYPHRPGFHCRYCPKSKKHNDGPCQLG